MATILTIGLVGSFGAAVKVAVPDSVHVPQPVYHAGWHPLGIPDQQETVRVVIAAKQQNQDALTEFVAQVSNPRSEKYGQYMTMAQVNAFTRPRDEDIATILDFLAPVCPVHINEVQGIVSCDISVKDAEQLFATEFRRYTFLATGQSVVRAKDYLLPKAVHGAMDALFGLHGLPLPRKQAQNAPGMPPPVTPSVLYDAYGIKGVTPTGSTKNKMAVAEFQGQFMSTSDLRAFFKMFLPKLPESDAEVYEFHGKTDVNGDGVEAQLDIQFMMGTAPGIKTEFYEQANMDFCADLQNWTSILLSSEETPSVHSVSYGWQGNLTQIGCKDEEVTTIDGNYKKLAAAGISIIFASGDSGSGYAPPQPPTPAQCSRSEPGTKATAYTGEILANLSIGVPSSDPFEAVWVCCEIAGQEGSREGYAGWTYKPRPCDGKKMCEASCLVLKTITGTTHKMGDYCGKSKPPPPPPPHPLKSTLYPSWPASSPYVTSVGATRFINDKVGGPEAAVNQEDHFGSGGGFSPWTFLTSPEYTHEATETYFKTVDPATLPDPSAVDIPKSGRATPDVSALGTGYAVVNGGKAIPGGVGGTSASAPVFAAIVALLNEARVQAGKPPMGLLNPFIYQNAEVFSDIVTGSNKVGRGGGTLKYGYNCTTGWDPVTGFGTPIFPKMLKAAMDAVA